MIINHITKMMYLLMTSIKKKRLKVKLALRIKINYY